MIRRQLLTINLFYRREEIQSLLKNPGEAMVCFAVFPR